MEELILPIVGNSKAKQSFQLKNDIDDVISWLSTNNDLRHDDKTDAEMPDTDEIDRVKMLCEVIRDTHICVNHYQHQSSNYQQHDKIVLSLAKSRFIRGSFAPPTYFTNDIPKHISISALPDD